MERCLGFTINQGAGGGVEPPGIGGGGVPMPGADGWKSAASAGI